MCNKRLLILLSAFVISLASCGANESSTTGSNSTYNNTSNISSSDSNSSSSSIGPVTTYSITYILNGGVNSANNPMSYIVGSTFTFSNPSRDGYTFTGWFDTNNNQVTEITNNTIGNLTLTAIWSATQYQLSITSESIMKGTVSIISGSGYSDETISILASPNISYSFTGWYNGSTKVSNDASYSFTMPKSNYSLVARFTYDEAKAISYGVLPNIAGDGKTLTYGLYPQTNVNNASLINSLNQLTTPSSNGYYLYQDNYYMKTVAEPYKSGYVFDNGTTIVDGSTYWFKCEPIKWNILKVVSDEYHLVSSSLLDAHYYYESQEIRNIGGYAVYPCDYEDSSIRTWLNDDFYNKAFALGHSYIGTTLVDNSASSANCSTTYESHNTFDKVFLLSYHDYCDASYGYPTDDLSTTLRQAKTTDWARARGAYYSEMSYYRYNGVYYTRSPYGLKNDYYRVWAVNTSGGIGFDSVELVENAIRPGIHLIID